ncbi:protein serine/threonine phosphatase 2C [Auriscalpium vulgare]|uniref:Protein serine/threonine phosphatase 2C n=1 Tax=Auriscalpium vulgare TaxID=40419 RepID=A0ACB8SCM5_9AGAM|nr:protein serine/threonine phosphatase 2C [Auriscalpium vulgare]
MRRYLGLRSFSQQLAQHFLTVLPTPPRIPHPLFDHHSHHLFFLPTIAMSVRLANAPRALLRSVVRPPAPLGARFTSTLPRPYRFHISASWLGKPPSHKGKAKNVPFPPDSSIGSWRDHTLSRQHPSLSRDPGEDFFYIQDMRNQSGVSFGVADGVGGWSDSGVDPSLFSQALMYHAHRYAKNGWPGEPETDPIQSYEEKEAVEGWELNPQECMKLAHDAVLREKFVLAGSSTACIINLNASNGVLRAANLGDSGFLILRSSSVFYRQRAQTHYFNCPKQLAKVPSIVKKASGAILDKPADADLYETKLRDGDIIIAFTDGLSDNVFNNEITSICSLIARAGGPEDDQVQTIADRIVEYSRACMANNQRVSPFEKAAARDNKFWPGGKMDDVTVVVALVREVL